MFNIRYILFQLVSKFAPSLVLRPSLNLISFLWLLINVSPFALILFYVFSFLICFLLVYFVLSFETAQTYILF